MAAAYEAAGREPPVPPEHLVTATIALETGLSLQHYADPEAVPLELLAGTPRLAPRPARAAEP